jgi:hypothetical protein
MSWSSARCVGIVVAAVALAACGEGGPGGQATGLTDPCDLDTGYPGDDLCIRPPPPGEGMQLHFGPEAYDEASVEPFLIYPGEESTECVLVNTPNDAEAWVSSFHGRMRPGTHHMITYTMADELPNTDEPGPCSFGFQSSQFLLGSQELEVDIATSAAAPEHEGYAMRIAPRQQARIELHYINTTEAPILRESWINLGFMDADRVTKQTSPLFWIAKVGMEIPARTDGHLVHGTCAVPSDGPDDLEIMVMTGHFHANTVRMSAWLTDDSRHDPCTDGSTDGCTLLYEGYDYVDPGNVRFNSATTNPSPDRSQNVPGGDYSGRLLLEPGQRVDWECEVDNPHDFPMGFANEVDTAEMCNIFGNYAPSMDDSPWRCIVF